MSQTIPYQLFDPALTVEENAEKLGCSVPAIRKYIRASAIDRKFDVAYNRWKTIQDYHREYPSASYAEMHRNLGYSINTIKKYLNLTEEQIYQSKRDTDKVSDFDVLNKNSIKSISYSQDEILSWVIRLYNDGKTFDADLTASILVFYKKVPKPAHLFDKYPQLDEVQDLSIADALPDQSFSSIIYDLPFVISIGKSGIIRDRFNCYSSVKELYAVNDEMLERAYRLLKKKGLLVIKTMDITYAGKQYWVSDYVLSKAKEKGLVLLDKFILLAKSKIFSHTHQQVHSRKYHSYFFVFRRR